MKHLFAAVLGLGALGAALSAPAAPHQLAPRAPDGQTGSFTAAQRRQEADDHLSKGRPTQALSAYREALAIDPADALARLGTVQSLSEIGSHVVAWEEAVKTPRLFPAELLAELRHRAAVELLRQSRASEEATRARLLDKSIALMLATKATGEWTDSRASDLVVAYAERGRPNDAVATYESLQAGANEKQRVQRWAQLPAAESYVALGRLTEAEALLRRMRTDDPANQQVVYALAYVLSDLHRFEDASALLLGSIQELQRKKDPELAYARQLLVRLRMWAGDRKQSRELLAAGLQAAPSDPGLLRLQAVLARDGARPAQADAALRIAERLERQDLDTRLARVELDADRSLLAAERRLGELREDLGDIAAVRRTAAELAQRRAAQLRMSASVNADRDSTSELRQLQLTSAAMGPGDTRVVLDVGQQRDVLREQSVSRTRQLVGVRTHVPEAGTLQVSAVTQTFSGSGLSVEWSGSPVDQLIARVAYASLDTDIAPRALVQGVRATSAEAGVRWVMDEGELSSSVRQQELSDGNTRRSLAFARTGQMQSWGNARPGWTLRAGLESASKTDVSYFSPKRSVWTDAEFSLALSKWQVPGTTQHLALRPVLSLGTFKQAGYGTLVTTSAGLGGTWDISSGTSAGFSAQVVRRPYDGEYTVQRSGTVFFNTRLP